MLTRRPWLAFALTAIAYFGFGRLALLLAIPPGYASPVWPAAGVALAMVLVGGRRMVPAVMLGSFAVNVSGGLDPADPVPGLQVAAAIGFGAGIQAWVGAALIDRLLGHTKLLGSLGHSLRFLVLGGPVACLVNASVGIGALYAAGFVDAEGVAYSWATWWVGDATGAMVMAPLALVWITPHSRRSRLALTGPSLVVLAAAVTVFVLTSGYERVRLQSEFDARVLTLENALRTHVQAHEASVDAVAGVFTLAPSASQEDLEEFASLHLRDQAGLQALEWVARVAGVDREAYEAAWQPMRDIDGAPAPEAEWHYPVTLVTPIASNERALGLDLGSNADSLEAIDKAWKARRPVASAPVRLVQDEAPTWSMLLFAPGEGGLALGVIRIPDLLQHSFEDLPIEGLRIELSDETGTLHRLGPEEAGELPEPRERMVRIGLREHTLSIAPGPAWLESHRRWDAWAGLIAGLVICSIVSVTSLDLLSRNAQVEAEVDERTRALAAANEALARSNRELEDFAYVASHDLQEPLRMVSSFATLLEEEYREALEGDGVIYLGHLVDGAGRMNAMIRDLLELSRVRRLGSPMVEVDLDSVLAIALGDLGATIAQADGSVEVDPMPRVVGDESQLHRLLVNLINNGLKFRGDQPARVEVRVEERDGRAVISIRDHGIGIDPEHHERIFHPFQRLHGRARYGGTGIGLAICRSIVERHGGRLEVDSALGEGAIMSFDLELPG